MAKEKRPYMPFYGREFYQDENVMLMTLEQEGAFKRLLWNCWQEGSIPSDLAKLAAICKNTPLKIFEKRIWPALKVCFTPTEDGRLINNKIERVRQESQKYRDGQSERGRLGAEKRWNRHRRAAPPPDPRGAAATPSPDPATAAPSAEPEPDSPLWQAWQRFIEQYPNRIEVDFAAQTWLSLVTSGVITESVISDIEAGLARWIKSDQWARDDGRYIPSPVKWLRDKRWLDHPPASAEAKTAERNSKRSRDGIDPNAEWIPPWRKD